MASVSSIHMIQIGGMYSEMHESDVVVQQQRQRGFSTGKKEKASIHTKGLVRECRTE